jgi:hypothetical protein
VKHDGSTPAGPLPIKRIHDRWINDYTRAATELLKRLDDS